MSSVRSSFETRWPRRVRPKSQEDCTETYLETFLGCYLISSPHISRHPTFKNHKRGGGKWRCGGVKNNNIPKTKKTWKRIKDETVTWYYLRDIRDTKEKIHDNWLFVSAEKLLNKQKFQALISEAKAGKAHGKTHKWSVVGPWMISISRGNCFV